MKKVSVIVPAYNAERYLNKCLDSLVNQTLEEIEIVVVDDGSTDSTCDILQKYREKYAEKVIVLSKENGGQASARNLALLHATGDFIGFVDADDFADVTMYEKMYNVAKNSDADLVVCDHYEVKNEKYLYKRFNDYEDPKGMFVDVLVSPWNKLIRKDILTESGVIFPEGYIYEDTAWFIEIIPYIKKMINIHEPFLYHVVQENSTMTAKQGERTAQIFPVLDGVIDFYHERNLFDEYFQELEYFYIRILFFSSLKRIAHISDRKLKKSLTKRTLEEVRLHFPHYKDNKYLHGKKGLYIKGINSFTIGIYVSLLRVRKI